MAARGRLAEIIGADLELGGVAWGTKEHVRRLLWATETSSFQQSCAAPEHVVKAIRMPEAKSLCTALRPWRRPLLTHFRSQVTNARSEAAHLTAKNLKRIGRGYTNHANYRTRTLLYTAAQKAG